MPEFEFDPDGRIDAFMKTMRAQDIDKVRRIVGPGPFFCSLCGKKLVESGHLAEKFFLCEDAGEFTWGPPSLVRVEVDGVSYAVADVDSSEEELTRERGYYEMCVQAHARSRRDAAGTEELKEANDRRAGRGYAGGPVVADGTRGMERG